LNSAIQDLTNSCKKFLYILFCLCLVFYIQKMHWRVHSLAYTFSYLTVFLTIE
jgi:hypothetical protein